MSSYSDSNSLLGHFAIGLFLEKPQYFGLIKPPPQALVFPYTILGDLKQNRMLTI